MKSTAFLSPCGQYRYRLDRIWDSTLPIVLFVMLNPSTADADSDDPTINKCMGFAKRWGYGGITVTNLFAYRATDPKALKVVSNPYGMGNSACVKAIAWEVSHALGLVVLAWGAHGEWLQEGRKTYQEMSAIPDIELLCLGTTKLGHPKHPLYLSYSTEPVLYRPASFKITGHQNPRGVWL